MIYLDNAATTLIKPDEVYETSNEVFRLFSANAGRGSHSASLKSAEIIYGAREEIGAYFGNSKPENVIFTFGCTDSLNLVIKGLFEKNDRIITTAYEHNSVLRPLEYMKNTVGIEYTAVFPDKSGNVSATAIENEIKPNTRAIIVNYVSNVTGHVQDISKISAICKKHNLLFILDCAQAAGTQDINQERDNIDYICAPGHKGLYGPQGIGLLLIRDGAPIPKPLRHGDTGSRSFELTQPLDLPEYLESGTQTVQNIAALNEGIKFVKRIDLLSHEIMLSDYLRSLLACDGITLYTPCGTSSGVTALNVKDADSKQIADILDRKYDIAVRGGLHCAPLVHKFLGTVEQGAVRLSVGAFNTKKEIEDTAEAILSISKKL